MELTDAELAEATTFRNVCDGKSLRDAVDAITLLLRQVKRQARAEGMEQAAKVCHALNLTLEYKGQPLQDCISNRIRNEARKLKGE